MCLVLQEMRAQALLSWTVDHPDSPPLTSYSFLPMKGSSFPFVTSLSISHTLITYLNHWEFYSCGQKMRPCIFSVANFCQVDGEEKEDLRGNLQGRGGLQCTKSLFLVGTCKLKFLELFSLRIYGQSDRFSSSLTHWNGWTALVKLSTTKGSKVSQRQKPGMKKFNLDD